MPNGVVVLGASLFHLSNSSAVHRSLSPFSRDSRSVIWIAICDRIFSRCLWIPQCSIRSRVCSWNVWLEFIGFKPMFAHRTTWIIANNGACFDKRWTPQSGMPGQGASLSWLQWIGCIGEWTANAWLFWVQPSSVFAPLSVWGTGYGVQSLEYKVWGTGYKVWGRRVWSTKYGAPIPKGLPRTTISLNFKL